MHIHTAYIITESLSNCDALNIAMCVYLYLHICTLSWKVSGSDNRRFSMPEIRDNNNLVRITRLPGFRFELASSIRRKGQGRNMSRFVREIYEGRCEAPHQQPAKLAS